MQGIAMARDSGVDTQNATGKRVYSAPRLTVFGDVATLTAAGSKPFTEHPKPGYGDYFTICESPKYPADTCYGRP